MPARVVIAAATVSSTPSWISAVATSVLGIAGLTFTLWQWWASGFRPSVKVELDAAREAIRVRITNRGRAAGVIGRLAAVDGRGIEIPWASANGFAEGKFSPTRLPGLDYMEVILEASRDCTFDIEHMLQVDWATTTKRVSLTPVDVGLYGTSSLLPP